MYFSILGRREKGFCYRIVVTIADLRVWSGHGFLGCAIECTVLMCIVVLGRCEA